MAFSLVRHVFFDLDHTLWDFESNSQAALESLYIKHNLSRLGIGDVRRFLSKYNEVNHECWAEYREGRLTKEVLRYIRFHKTFEYFGLDDLELSTTISEDYVAISPFQKRLMPGTIDVLEYLKNGYQLHIITNGFEEVQHIKLKESGLRPYFDKIITSEAVDARKPSPIIFDHALNETGALKGNSMIIGDNLEADILGAQNAGWKQVFYNPKKLKHDQYPDVEINDLLQLKNYL